MGPKKASNNKQYILKYGKGFRNVSVILPLISATK